MKDYLHDIKVVQSFAALNRLAIIEIAKGMKWKIETPYSCIHNYIDFENKDAQKPILRKGAVSARKGEKVIIPINMRDGVILGTGKGNAEWNYSAPHGSGRIMKRGDVKKSFTVSSFKSSMKGIYSSCIGKETLDEAPFAYRGIDEIRNAILSEDEMKIKKIKGIGPKTAQHVVTDLKDKIVKGEGSDATLPLQINNSAIMEEAARALVMLGFAKPNVNKVLQTLIKNNPSAKVEELIKDALKML